SHAYQSHDYFYGSTLLLRKVIVEGLGHAWSGGDDRHPFNDSKGPNASEMIWEFVSQFRRHVESAHAPASLAAS
ncbi:MAG: esterase, partial [Burkholderiales bacterium]|nr:esterase [Burkholderiales bacterium]